MTLRLRLHPGFLQLSALLLLAPVVLGLGPWARPKFRVVYNPCIQHVAGVHTGRPVLQYVHVRDLCAIACMYPETRSCQSFLAEPPMPPRTTKSMYSPQTLLFAPCTQAVPPFFAA